MGAIKPKGINKIAKIIFRWHSRSSFQNQQILCNAYIRQIFKYSYYTLHRNLRKNGRLLNASEINDLINFCVAVAIVLITLLCTLFWDINQSIYIYTFYRKLFTLDLPVHGSNSIVRDFKMCEKNKCPCNSRDKAGMFLLSFSTDNQGKILVM